jgi:hypothetical protein
MLYRWLRLFREHKALWLGALDSVETPDAVFLKRIVSLEYSPFASSFTRLTAFSFLQSHRDPALYRQTVF